MSLGDVQQIKREAIVFLETVFSRLHGVGLDMTGYELDHICYRVSSLDEYRAARESLVRCGKLLVESPIGGRPIATYLLNEPILFEGRAVRVLELPAPKPGSPYPCGFEHVEFVIKESFDVMMKRHSGLRWDIDGIGKTHNPELGLVFDDCRIKFHHKALADLVADEIRQRGSVT